MNTYYKNIEEKFLAADEMIEVGDVKEAKELLESIVMEDPTYGRAHNHLGWIYTVHFSDYKRAERHLKLALKYAPDYPSGYKNYARLLLDLNKPDDMLELINKALLVPGVNKALMFRFMGVAAEMKGDYKTAYKQFRRSHETSFEEGWFDIIKEDFKRLRKKVGLASWLVLWLFVKRNA
ncbi:MAG: hypothetical protein RIS47_49 [Bacteroidota bacterium]